MSSFVRTLAFRDEQEIPFSFDPLSVVKVELDGAEPGFGGRREITKLTFRDGSSERVLMAYQAALEWVDGARGSGGDYMTKESR